MDEFINIMNSFSKREEEPMKPNPWPGLLALLLVCLTLVTITWLIVG